MTLNAYIAANGNSTTLSMSMAEGAVDMAQTSQPSAKRRSSGTFSHNSARCLTSMKSCMCRATILHHCRAEHNRCEPCIGLFACLKILAI
eukprot:4122747-Amphidinium_carterae.1